MPHIRREGEGGVVRCAPAMVDRGRGGPLDRAPPRRAKFEEEPVRGMAILVVLMPPPPMERRDVELGAPPRCCLSWGIVMGGVEHTERTESGDNGEAGDLFSVYLIGHV